MGAKEGLDREHVLRAELRPKQLAQDDDSREEQQYQTDGFERKAD